MGTCNFSGVLKYNSISSSRPPIEVKGAGSVTVSGVLYTIMGALSGDKVVQQYANYDMSSYIRITPPDQLKRPLTYTFRTASAPAGFSGSIDFSDWYQRHNPDYPPSTFVQEWVTDITGQLSYDESYLYPNFASGEEYFSSISYSYKTPSGLTVIGDPPLGTLIRLRSIEYSPEDLPSSWKIDFSGIGGSTGLRVVLPLIDEVTYDKAADKILVSVYLEGTSVIPPEDHCDVHVNFNTLLKTISYSNINETQVFTFDGPFAGQGKVGEISLSLSRKLSAQQAPVQHFTKLNPFLIVDAKPHFKLRNEYNGNAGLCNVPGLVRVNRTFGFNSLPDHYALDLVMGAYESNAYFEGAALGLLPQFNNYIFIPQWFIRNGFDENPTLVLNALNPSENVLCRAYVESYDESINTLNQAQFSKDESPIIQVTADADNDLQGWVTVPSLSPSLLNRTYPSTVYLHNNSGVLLVFNQREKQWDLYTFVHHDKQYRCNLMATEIWDDSYFAARLTRLINGSLLTTAWTLDEDMKTFRCKCKMSFDGGTSWGNPVVMFTRVDNPDPEEEKFDSFQPTWSITESFTTGTLLFGNYKSDDMGLTWY